MLCSGLWALCSGSSCYSFWFSVHPSGSPLAPTYGWCPMCVGHNTSSTSPGWSLLPSSVFIVLALVNSDVPHQGTWVSQRDPGVLPRSLPVLLPQDCCAFWLVPVCIMVEATSMWTAWLPPCVFHIWHMTILGIPGWAPTEDMQPKLWVKAHLVCNPSHQVWIVRTLGKGNTLLYQRVFLLDPYVHVQAGMARMTIHLGGKDGLG